MNILKIDNAAFLSFIASFAAVAMILITFVIFEPVIGRAATDEFIITQTITGEVSFKTAASDVSLGPAIQGLTGGVRNGATYVVITTNDTNGYNLTIAFSNSAAMQRNGGGGDIPDYVTAVAGFADFVFDSTKPYGQFGYTVSASTTADLDLSFRNDGASCNSTGGGEVAASCWMNPSTTAETIVNRSSATPAGGSTTTLHFRVDVPPNPVPAISTGVYTATATLTAVTN